MATIYSGSDAGKSGLEMVELDGSPDVRGVSKIKVSNTTLTDDGNGEVTLITGGGGGGSGTVTSVATTAPITGGTITTSGTIGITQSTTSTDGYLSSTDWNTFDGKLTVLILLMILEPQALLTAKLSLSSEAPEQVLWMEPRLILRSLISTTPL